MDTPIDRQLLHPFPTVLEIVGFTAEATQELRSLVRAHIKQPSYISRANVTSATPLERTANVGQITLALPLGVMYSFTRETPHRWWLTELSPCCGQQRNRNFQKCSQCENQTTPMMDDTTFYFQEETEEGELVPFNDLLQRNGEVMENVLLEHLERQEKVNVLTAILMAAEMKSLFLGLVSHNNYVTLVNKFNNFK